MAGNKNKPGNGEPKDKAAEQGVIPVVKNITQHGLPPVEDDGDTYGVEQPSRANLPTLPDELGAADDELGPIDTHGATLFDKMLEEGDAATRSGVLSVLGTLTGGEMEAPTRPTTKAVFDTEIRTGVAWGGGGRGGSGDVGGAPYMPGTPEYREVFEDDEEVRTICSGLPACAINSTVMQGKSLVGARIEMGESAYMSVFDVGGSTNIFEKLESPDCPEEIYADFITTYQEIHRKITDSVEQYGGDVLQFQGDAQITVFPDQISAIEASRRIKHIIEDDLSRLQRLLERYNERIHGRHNPEEVCGLRNVLCSAAGLTFQVKRSLNIRIEPGEVMDRVKAAEKAAKEIEGRMSPEERNRMHGFQCDQRTGSVEGEYHFRDSFSAPHLNKTGLKMNSSDIPQDAAGLAELKARLIQEVKDATGSSGAQDKQALGHTYSGVGVPMFIYFARDTGGVDVSAEELEAVQEAIVAVVERDGGHVNKDLNGEGIFVIFGAGLDMEQQDPLERGIRTGESVRKFMRGASNPTSLKIAGISVGEKKRMVRMVVGTARRNETTVMGTAANRGARTGAEALRIAREQRETVVVAGVNLSSIGHICTGQTFRHEAKGVAGGITAVKVETVKEPQHTVFVDEITQSLQVVSGQETPYKDFETQVKNRSVVKISGASEAVQEIFIQIAAREVDNAKLCMFRPEVVDQFTEYRSLLKILRGLGEEYGIAVFGTNKEPSPESAALGEAIAKGEHQNVKEHLARILEKVYEATGKPVYLCALEADTVDARSMDALESAIDSIKAPYVVKFIAAGKEIEGSHISTSHADKVTAEGAQKIVEFLLKNRLGIETEEDVMETTDMERLVRILEGVGREKVSLAKDGNIEVVNINPIVNSLILDGNLYQEGRIWKLKPDVEDVFQNQAGIFDTLVGPLVRKVSPPRAKGERLRNFALCFAVAKEPINFKHMPKAFRADKSEWDEFVSLLASRSILRPVHVAESEFTLYEEGAFQLEPKLQAAAEACLAANRNTKAAVHLKIAAQYKTTEHLQHKKEKNGDLDETTTAEVQQTKTQRRHFLEHFGKYLEMADPQGVNFRRVREYLRLLIYDIQEDLERDDFPNILRKTKVLTQMCEVFKGPSEEETDEYVAREYYLEAISRLTRAAAATRSGIDLLAPLAEEGELMDVCVGAVGEEREAVKILKLLIGFRILAMDIEQMSQQVSHKLKKDAKRTNRDRGIVRRIEGKRRRMREINSEYRTRPRLNHSVSLVTLYRLANALQIEADVPRFIAGALGKLDMDEHFEGIVESASRRYERVDGLLGHIGDYERLMGRGVRKNMSRERMARVHSAISEANRTAKGHLTELRAGLDIEEILKFMNSGRPAGEKRREAIETSTKDLARTVKGLLQKAGLEDEIEGIHEEVLMSELGKERDPFTPLIFEKAATEAAEIMEARASGGAVKRPKLGALGNLSHYLRSVARARLILFGEDDQYRHLARKARLCAEHTSELNQATGEPMYEWEMLLRYNAAEAAIEEGNNDTFKEKLADMEELRRWAPRQGRQRLEDEIYKLKTLAEEAGLKAGDTA